MGSVGLSRGVLVGVLNRVYWMLHRHALLPTRNLPVLLKTHTNYSYSDSAKQVTAYGMELRVNF